jgi:hypothetical protein
VLLKLPLLDLLRIAKWRLYDAAKVALGIHNLYPGHYYPKVGPWWFIPFIVQFYLLWSFLGGRLTSLSKNAMLAVGLSGIAFKYVVIPLVQEQVKINLLFTPLGHIPEIMLGVYWARYGLTLSTAMVLGSLIVFVLSSLFTLAWPLHHISALVLMLWLVFRVLSIDSDFINRSISILGIYSMPLFLVNGPIRKPFLAVSRHADVWYVDLIAAVILLFVALGVAVLLSRAENYFIRRIGLR